MTAFPHRLSRILADVPEATAIHIYDGGQLEAWLKEAPKDRAPLPPPKGNRPANALLTLQDVAARLQVSKKQVRKLVDDGDLRYINIGRGSKHRQIRFHPDDVEECLQRLAKRNMPSCQSTKTRAHRSTNIHSQSDVIGFTARLNARRAEKRKR
jgi:excisionase family DNA binding protein